MTGRIPEAFRSSSSGIRKPHEECLTCECGGVNFYIVPSKVTATRHCIQCGRSETMEINFMQWKPVEQGK